MVQNVFNHLPLQSQVILMSDLNAKVGNLHITTGQMLLENSGLGYLMDTGWTYYSYVQWTSCV